MKFLVDFFHQTVTPNKYYWDELQGKVLNYGCGPRKHKSHIGVDIDEKSAADIIIKPGKKLPFNDQDFDTVISRFVLEHIEDTDFVMSEISRILKPNGEFRFLVPHAYSIDAFDDPTHVSFFGVKTPSYYCNGVYTVYVKNYFSEYHAYVRVSLAWPKLKIIRYPINLFLVLISRISPYFSEQIIKFPFLKGEMYVIMIK